MEDYKFLFKVVLIGEAGVGKTCLVRRFCQGVYPIGQAATIGVDFMIKNMEIKGERIKLQIWDTAGQERFRTITQSYYRSANAIIIVYDISNQPSFDRLPEWLRELRQHINDRVTLILVGNKSDLTESREIPYHIGELFAQRHNMRFIETSAKESANVEQIFTELTETLLKQANEYLDTRKNDTKVLRDDVNSTKMFNCC
ncbi:ras-related Rab-30 [Brachionus plicatilis]|uniref:Ras-related Rab-30 n=1 Tax=Brachionus plicatilis TaxID=10195 RepID=A0A3M7QDE4_BRAPC|nr:ras-related Rab-30 [Brachionus plicatilis]